MNSKYMWDEFYKGYDNAWWNAQGLSPGAFFKEMQEAAFEGEKFLVIEEVSRKDNWENDNPYSTYFE